MTKNMKKVYRMFRRKNRQNYYIQNNNTLEQRCLGTSDKEEAQRLLDAANQARQAPALNMQLGKAYITHADPKMATRTWLESWHLAFSVLWKLHYLARLGYHA